MSIENFDKSTTSIWLELRRAAENLPRWKETIANKYRQIFTLQGELLLLSSITLLAYFYFTFHIIARPIVGLIDTTSQYSDFISYLYQ